MNARIVLAIAAILLWAAPPPASAQAIQWSAVAQGSGNPESYPSAVKVDAGGNVIITGNVQGAPGDMRTVKYAAGTGQVLWQVVTPNAGAGGMAIDPAGDLLIAGSMAQPGANNAGVVFKFNGATGALVWQAIVPDGGFAGIASDTAGNAVATGFVNPGQMRTVKVSASGAILWNTVLPAYASGNFVAVDFAGDVVVAGAHVSGGNANYATVKLRGGDGGVTWQRTFNGAANFDDFVAGLAIDGSGNAIVAGRSVNATGRLSAATVKYAAADGATMWQNVIDGGSTGFYFARAVGVDGAGNVVLVGVGSVPADSRFHFMTVKLAAATGVEQWRRIDAGTNTTDGTAIAVDAVGNAFVGGIEATATATNFRLMRYAPDGTMTWQAAYTARPSTPNEAVSVALDPQGQLAVAGRTFTGTANDYLALKFDGASGSVLWRGDAKPIPRSASMRLATSGRSTLARDPAGNAIVAGSASNGTNDDMKVVKYDAMTGSVAWERTINVNSGDDNVLAIATDASGNVVIGGRAGGAGGDRVATSSSTHVAKLSAIDGSTLWQNQTTTTASNNNRTLAVAIDAAGNVFAASAYTTPGTPGSLFEVRRLDGATGSLAWSRTMTHYTNANDEPVAIAVDPSGNLIVTGVIYQTVDAQARTAKFAGADGTLLWEASYNTGVSGNDVPTSLAVDGAGNVFVSGYWRNGGTNDYFTIKYSGSTGSPLWTRTIDAGSFDEAYAAAIDGNGDVIVTGSSNAGSAVQFRTVKYSSLGRTMWDRSYSSPGNLGDYAYALSITAAGDPIVVGVSVVGDYSDWKVVKLSGVDGSALWERAFNGTANREDRGLAVVTVPGAVYVAGICEEGALQSICTQRIEDSGVAAASDGPSDFDGDRFSDITWKHADGRIAMWLMHGSQQSGGAGLMTAGAGWEPKLLADFDGDGQTDIVWQHPDGRVAMWLMNGTVQVGGALLMKAGAGWTPVLAADFSGRGRAGIVWQHADGRVAMWLMNGTVQTGGALLLTAGSGWEPRFAADFDGDGVADLIWVHRDGRVAMWLMNGAQQVGAGPLLPAHPGWVPRLVGDFNGDRSADILWQHTDGRSAIWLMRGTAQLPGGTVVMAAGSGWHATRLADTNGDGRDDIVWQHEDGRIAVWLMDGAQQLPGGGYLATAGSGWSVKRAVDFNRDGRDDLVVQHADGTVAMWLMNGSTFTATTLLKGASGWTLVP